MQEDVDVLFNTKLANLRMQRGGEGLNCPSSEQELVLEPINVEPAIQVYAITSL